MHERPRWRQVAGRPETGSGVRRSGPVHEQATDRLPRRLRAVALVDLLEGYRFVINRSSSSRPSWCMRRNIGMSRNGLHDPNSEPCTRCSKNVVLCPRKTTSPSCRRSATAVNTSVPPLPTQAEAASMTSAFILPTVTMTTSAPVPRDNSRANAAASRVSETVYVPPNDKAKSRFIATGSTPMTCRAPACTAPWTALTPTPPRPTTTTVSPGRTPPVYTADPQPVGTAQASRAAVSIGTCDSIRTQEFSLRTVHSAKAPTRHNPPRGSPSSRRGQRPLGSCPVDMVAPWSQRFDRPVAQYRQAPQTGTNAVMM